MMGGPVQRCNHCGANLSLDDMRGTNCPYCSTVFPHHAQAAQHAVLVNQVLDQQLRQRGIAPMGDPQQYGMPPTYGAYGAPPQPLVNPMLMAQQVHSTVNKTIKMVLILTTVGVAFSVVIVAAVLYFALGR